MSKVIKWVIGILFGALIAFAAWKVFTNPSYFLGGTTKVNGKVVDVFPSREVKTHRRRVKYVYEVNDKYYYDFYSLGTQDKKQAIGNTIQISYSNKYPQYNMVEKLLNDYRNSNAVRYYSAKEKGYIDIRLINGIFKYREYADQGKLTNESVGEYEVENDSVHFVHYVFDTDTLMKHKLTMLVFDTKSVNQLNDIDNDRIYKRVKKESKIRRYY